MKGEIKKTNSRIDFLEEKSDLIAKNLAKIVVTLIYSDGTPAKNIYMSGLKTYSGGNVVSDNSGIAVGYISGNTATTISIRDYGDIVPISSTYTKEAGSLTNIQQTLQLRSFLKIQSTTSLRFSPRTRRVEYALCGGGGGGAGYYNAPGGGGAGGNVAYGTLQPNSSTTYAITIGSGGAGGNTNSTDTSWTSIKGKDGGTTMFNETTATGGGSGGRDVVSSSTMTNVGSPGYSQNGNGGSARNDGLSGTNYVYASETTTVLCGGGGGGGGKNPISGGYEPARGGSPYGGNGAYKRSTSVGGLETVAATNGLQPGGGGGGGLYDYDYPSRPGANGGYGLATLRFTFI